MTARDLSGIEYLLGQWAHWMHYSRPDLGYRHKVPGMLSGYVSATLEELCEPIDQAAIHAVDACIHDLPSASQAAVHSIWLGSKWVLAGVIKETRDECYARAVEMLPGMLERRGVRV